MTIRSLLKLRSTYCLLCLGVLTWLIASSTNQFNDYQTDWFEPETLYFAFKNTPYKITEVERSRDVMRSLSDSGEAFLSDGKNLVLSFNHSLKYPFSKENIEFIKYAYELQYAYAVAQKMNTYETVGSRTNYYNEYYQKLEIHNDGVKISIGEIVERIKKEQNRTYNERLERFYQNSQIVHHGKHHLVKDTLIIELQVTKQTLNMNAWAMIKMGHIHGLLQGHLLSINDNGINVAEYHMYYPSVGCYTKSFKINKKHPELAYTDVLLGPPATYNCNIKHTLYNH